MAAFDEKIENSANTAVKNVMDGASGLAKAVWPKCDPATLMSGLTKLANLACNC